MPMRRTSMNKVREIIRLHERPSPDPPETWARNHQSEMMVPCLLYASYLGRSQHWLGEYVSFLILISGDSSSSISPFLGSAP